MKTHPDDLRGLQLSRLQEMVPTVVSTNEFYRRKLKGISNKGLLSLEDLQNFPFTTKDELVQDQVQTPPFGTNLTFSLDRYTRLHQTSGTTGIPLRWLDTEDSWDWQGRCWKAVLQAAGVHSGDRVFFGFSFGPFIGFWSGWEGVRHVGALAIPGGGQTTLQRIKTIIETGATVVICTPTYALHMAAEAAKNGIDLGRRSNVRLTIHAGEPGASIPSTKARIEAGWGTKCYDHAGATEVGAWGFECEPQPGGIHVNEYEFIVNVVDPATGKEVGEGERGEMIITNLGRVGSPVIRYKTGDIVQASHRPCPCGRPLMLLEGGVLGRVDDMVVVRGVNVFPSALEEIIRGFQEIEEFRVEFIQTDELAKLKLTLEPKDGSHALEGLEARVAEQVKGRLGLRPEVKRVPSGTLPRFELKARRFFKQ